MKFFVCFGPYLFVRALLAKTLTYVDTGRSSGTCGRGLSSIRPLQLACRAHKVFFFRWEWIRRYPGFLCMRPILYVRVKKCLFLLPSPTSTQPRTYTTGRQQNMQRARRYNAAVHKHEQATPCACDTPICAILLWLQYLCSSEPAVRNPPSIPVSAAAVCNRSTLTVAGNVRITRIKYQYLSCINICDVACSSPKLTPEM